MAKIKLQSIPSITLKKGDGWTLIYDGTKEGVDATVTNTDAEGVRVWYGEKPNKDEMGIWIKSGDVMDVSKEEKLYGKATVEDNINIAITKRLPV